MKLQVTFTVDVDWQDEDLGPVKPTDPLVKRIEASVAEAVDDALQRQQGDGFNHDMDSLLAILVDSPIVAKLI